MITTISDFVNESSKFTFKTNKPTGRFKAFDSPYHDIKLDGHVVGQIDNDKPHKISLYVMKNGTTITDNNPNCVWKRITLTHESESIDAAKTWLNANRDAILKKFELKKLD